MKKRSLVAVFVVAMFCSGYAFADNSVAGMMSLVNGSNESTVTLDCTSNQLTVNGQSDTTKDVNMPQGVKQSCTVTGSTVKGLASFNLTANSPTDIVISNVKYSNPNEEYKCETMPLCAGNNEDGNTVGEMLEVVVATDTYSTNHPTCICPVTMQSQS